jgi:hypothetical protein
MRGANLAISPGVRQTFHEAIEIRMAVREHVDAFTRGQAGEMMLDRSNFIEETQGVEGTEDGSQSIFHRFSDGRRGQQPSTGRFRRVVALTDMGADPFLVGEFERGLEEVHE